MLALCIAAPYIKGSLKNMHGLGRMRTANNHLLNHRGHMLLLFIWQSAHAAVAVDLIGYLPSYRMGAAYNNNVLPTQLGMLNEVRYFGLTAGSDGSIQPLPNT